MSDKLPWKVLSQKTILENPWFSVLNSQVRNPKGKIHDYHTVSFAGPAVGVIARNKDRYLLIHQYRFIVEEFVWAIPSGGVEPDESLSDAAHRELVEETGWKAKSLTHLFGYYPSYGATDQRFELFLAEDLEPAESDFDSDEVLKIDWFDKSSIVEMILENRIVDGLSLTPLAVLLMRESLGIG